MIDFDLIEDIANEICESEEFVGAEAIELTIALTRTAFREYLIAERRRYEETNRNLIAVMVIDKMLQELAKT